MIIDTFDRLSINSDGIIIIDGKKIAQGIMGELKKLSNNNKFLAAVLVGSDPASESFLRQKEKVAKELGVDFRIFKFSENVLEDDLRGEVSKILAHKTCGGVIVQLPLPSAIDPQYVLNAIPREKDVDVLGERALGAFYAGRNPVLPPAVGVVEKILSTLNFSPSTSSVAVIGLGALVGKPISLYLERKCRNLYLLRRGSDFSILKKADLVISGAGSPGIITPDMLKDNAIVIDFGYGKRQMADSKKQVVGDFNPLSSVISRKLSVSYTPTPGGTGPILVASLLRNFYILNSK